MTSFVKMLNINGNGVYQIFTAKKEKIFWGSPILLQALLGQFLQGLVTEAENIAPDKWPEANSASGYSLRTLSRELWERLSSPLSSLTRHKDGLETCSTSFVEITGFELTGKSF